jgi:hypothetical protein
LRGESSPFSVTAQARVKEFKPGRHACTLTRSAVAYRGQT